MKDFDSNRTNGQIAPDENTQAVVPVSENGWIKLQKWYQENGRHNLPWRKNRSAWSMLLAEVLLRRTRADTVARVYPEIVQKFTDAKSVLDHKDKWIQLTSELGFPSRFDQFFLLCEIILTEYDGKIPVESKELMSLPGIGHYSSDAIRCFGLNENRFIVDTNTLRIASRITGNIIRQEQHRSTMARKLLEQAFGPENKITAERNFALLDLAALICTNSNPDCAVCPLFGVCEYRKKLNI